ncbi:hypothetical protein [Proteus faecis]|uniref:hypothetical protein n=2 Tax=Proteus TaxID=583 RepID=UPI0029E8E2AA|nr:hypothetical protein [Proteus mirabilis]
MNTALCTQDNQVWDAESFYKLSNEKLQLMRKSLLCTECHGNAWFRISSYGNNSPHFCAHHEENCPLATTYEVIGEGDGGTGTPAADLGNGIVLNLGKEKNYNIDVAKKDVEEHIITGQQRTSEQVKNGGGLSFPAHMTLKNVLYQLVRSDKLYSSDQRIIIKDDISEGLPQIANQLFVNFADVKPWLNEQKRIFWGFISDARQTKDGKIWLNAGNISSGLSIAINPEIGQDFKEYFKIEDSLDSLAGCHALIIGDCYYASSGKPVIWCANLNYLMLRRYNFTE